MSRIEQLVEQHIREHESRLAHIDELLARAEQGVAGLTKPHDEIDAELVKLRQEREKLVGHIGELRNKTPEEWQEWELEQAGPMIVWEAVAKRLEQLLERIEHHART